MSVAIISVVVVVVAFVIAFVETTHCVASLPRSFLSETSPPRSTTVVSQGGKRGTTMELFVQLFFPRFETFQRHFNERTRSILVAAQPSPPPSARTEPRHFFPLPPPRLTPVPCWSYIPS